MSKQVTATDAKNNFGGLLDDVAALGRVEVLKHGRVVAVVCSPRALEAAIGGTSWGEDHMIPPRLARGARMLSPPSGFDEE